MQAVEITLDEFATAHDAGAPVVDVRSPQEYAAGHVPGAVNVPLGEVDARSAQFTADPAMHVICESGGRSMKAAELLAAKGIQALSVAGGTKGWIESGRPAVSGPQPA